MMTSHRKTQVDVSDWTNWPVERIMTSPVVTVDACSPLEHARHALAARSLRRAPVVDGGVVVGMISARDMALASFLRIASDDCADKSAPVQPCTVREAMKDSAVTIHRLATVAQAAQRMLEHRVSALPVLDVDDHLIGIVTHTDLVRRVAQAELRCGPGDQVHG